MFDPEIADIRFGTGLSPRTTPPASVQQMLKGLTGNDRMAREFKIESFDRFAPRVDEFNIARRGSRRNRGTPEGDKFDQQRKKIVKAARSSYAEFFRNAVLRRIHTDTGLRERLAFFWADHFTAHGKVMIIKWSTSPYVESAIRPMIAGKFEDLLISAVTHPLMLNYLDQNLSFGPNSVAAKRAKRKDQQRGLNENLAREVLELHTLGVDGPYSQKDVQQLAELFTGMTYDKQGLFKFESNIAEPGAETIIGQRYGGKEAQLADIHEALRDLARHPVTSLHIAKKLARHFVSDTPDADLVQSMHEAYMAHGGELMPVYEAMLSHPASWQSQAQNVKQPLDFMASSLRALDISGEYLLRTREKELRNVLYLPLQVMGQPWERPVGPDGWPETNAHWITPQFMAARLQWALAAPQALRRTLPDPRDFARTALGSRLPQDVRFAAEAAENRWEGIAIVLASPAFQRQ